MSKTFEEVFGLSPTTTVSAPGRVNLLGEHTDYNDGFVFPSPLKYQTTLQAAKHDSIEAYATNFSETRTRALDEPKQNNWLDYIAACVYVLRKNGFDIQGIRATVTSDVPMSSGLSSSAALEVATIRALKNLYNLQLDDVQIAKLAQQAEVEYVGVRCGIMDQFASSVGRFGFATMLDTQDLSFQNEPLPAGYSVVVVDSGMPRKLAESGYNTRRAECEKACEALGIKSLRELSLKELDKIEALPRPLNKRAKHVVTENARVVEGARALRAGDLVLFGELMVASHNSLRDDYEVSIPELDDLVEIMLRHGAVGARLTGAGFGGATVALVPSEKLEVFKTGVSGEYPAAKFF